MKTSTWIRWFALLLVVAAAAASPAGAIMVAPPRVDPPGTSAASPARPGPIPLESLRGKMLGNYDASPTRPGRPIPLESLKLVRSATEVRAVATAPDGFDWSDAGIGAGVGTAAALFAAAGAYALRNRRLAHS